MANKPTFVAALLASLVCLAAPVRAEDPKEIGVGVIAGDPTGGTAKLWLDRSVALDFGVGFSGDVAFWADALYHLDGLLPQPNEGRLLPYLGAGPRIESGNDAEFGVRTIAGLSWRLTKQPLEFFAEAGPVFRVTQGAGWAWTAASACGCTWARDKRRFHGSFDLKGFLTSHTPANVA
ncbi:MAG: hypothetical protein M0D55_08345 [Elusimicrobiota bacterium]|nr:MAG: hypothetical protein M0D55_08345 [Elusimicrobiota bacterium]